jgi:hypothetical protein
MLKYGIRGLLLAVLMATVGGVLSLNAQDTPPPTPEGHWEGAIQVPGQGLEINIDLVEESGNWTGDISIPEQMLEDYSLGGIAVNGASVAFGMVGIPGEPSFRGTLSEDGQTLSGTFSQAGQSFPFTLTRSD